MDRKEYLVRLKAGLNRLPKNEKENVIAYYTEYFEDAGEEYEQAVIEELGDPKEVAGRVLAEMAIKYIDKPVKSPMTGFQAVKMTILAICAAPIALPLMAGGVIVVLSLALVLAVLYLCIWIMAITGIVGGVIGCAVGITLVFSDFPSTLAIVGASFICISLGGFSAYWGAIFTRWMSEKIIGGVKEFLKRRAMK